MRLNTIKPLHACIIYTIGSTYSCIPPQQHVGRDPDYDSSFNDTDIYSDLEGHLLHDASQDAKLTTKITDSRIITLPDASIDKDYQIAINKDSTPYQIPDINSILDATSNTRDTNQDMANINQDACYNTITSCLENRVIQYTSCGEQREIALCDLNQGFICENGQCVNQPQEVLNGRDDNNNGQIDEPYLGQAPLQIILMWQSPSNPNLLADLDLRVQSPDGCSVHYNNPSCYQGALDRDANPSCNLGNLPPENIIYDIPLNGRYMVFVDLNDNCNEPYPIPFFIAINNNGQIQEFSGQIEESLTSKLVIEFNY